MTAQARAEQDVDPASLASLTLDARQLGDLELILSGAFAPLTGFMSAADEAAVAESATCPTERRGQFPSRLRFRRVRPPAGAERVLLADPEGTPWRSRPSPSGRCPR